MANSRGTASSWLSNLPLGNRALSLKDKTKENSQALIRHPSPNAGVEVNDQDDEWSDCTSENTTSTSNESSRVTMKPITPAEEAELLQYMPSLFDTELPPCNSEIQIAYENVVKRLRKRWLTARGRVGAVDLCQAVKDELSNQNFMFPAFSLKGPYKKRKPWRRENVFKYELRWIDYFVREAQTQSPELMTESEIMERKKEASAPSALGLVIDRADVRAMWDEWNVRRRVKKPAVPVRAADSGLANGTPDGVVRQETNGSVKESRPDSGISDTIIAQPPEEDVRIWSTQDHD